MITVTKFVALAFALVAWSSSAFAIVKYEWDGNPQIVGKCFGIHGRLAQYNGGTPHRIWKIGTHRMFAVANETSLPEEIGDKIRDFDTEIYGDFLVCPLTTS